MDLDTRLVRKGLTLGRVEHWIVGRSSRFFLYAMKHV